MAMYKSLHVELLALRGTTETAIWYLIYVGEFGICFRLNQSFWLLEQRKD